MHSSERYIRVTQEWNHAATLFGQLNGTDWSVLMTVAHFTWGLQRESAELGIAIFSERMGQLEPSIRKSIAKLSRKREQGGFGMLRVVQESTHSQSRVLAIEDDWMVWAWPTEDDMARCALAMTAYRKGSKSEMSDWVPNEKAVSLATLLRDHCIGIVPEAEVPPIDVTHRQWRRWIQQFEKMLEKRSEPLLAGCIRFVHRDPFWSPQILGEHADLRLARNLDTIHARYVAHAKNRRTA